MSWLTDSVNGETKENEEIGDNYLTSTSYYKAAHAAISKCIGIIKPKHVLDFGCSMGVSLMMLAEEYPHIEFSGLEEDNGLAFIANNVASNYRNIDRIYFDKNVIDFANDHELFDFTYMLYKFRHIGTTIEDKFKFLEDFYDIMKPGSYLCVVDTLIDGYDDDYIDQLYMYRAHEVYASTLLSSLSSFDSAEVDEHKSFAVKVAYKELDTGKNIKEQQHDILFSKHLFTTRAKKIGFNVLFVEWVTGLGDYIILLQK